jgi:hypothetical protein
MNARATENRFYFEIFLVAAAVILLEISFTRIFSYKVFYYFTYLIIGISLLGLGSGLAGGRGGVAAWFRDSEFGSPNNKNDSDSCCWRPMPSRPSGRDAACGKPT